MISTIKGLQAVVPAMIQVTEKAPNILELSYRFHEAGYDSLADVLARAFEQAAAGKGAERHANRLPFDKQPMQTIAGQVGVGFLIGQAIKKTQESQTLPAGRDVAELLGAINYLAGAVIFLESQRVPVADNDNEPGLPVMACAKCGLRDPSMVHCFGCNNG